MTKSTPYASCRVLIVDDNQPTRLLLRELLKGEGLAGVYEAADGVEALERLEAHPFDVVFADMEMPGMSGLELLRRLRRGEGALNRSTPFVFVTAHANPALVGKARDLGVAGYVLKPISIGQVRAKLDIALHQGRALHDRQAKRPGEIGSGKADPGKADPGKAGPGKAGPGKAGPGKAGPGKAGPGKAADDAWEL